MKVVDLGSGPPVVVIPGIQGRWEWMKPGIEALAERCRVITFSLCDEPCSDARFDEESGFACYVEQVREAMDQRGVESAAICGISYGGLIAAAFAARYQARTRALLLVSALPPSWTPNPRVRLYLKAPRLLALLFWLGSPLRLYRELKAALPGRLERLRITLTYAARVFIYRPAASRMSRRARLVSRMEPIDLAGIQAPTLIVTGEPALDRVVPVAVTHQYARLIPHARLVTFERTGHVGLVTRPRAFANLVAPFVTEHAVAATGAEGSHTHAV